MNKSFLNVCPSPWICHHIPVLFPVNVWVKSICEDDEERQHNESHSRLSTLSLLNVSCSNNPLHFHIFCLVCGHTVIVVVPFWVCPLKKHISHIRPYGLCGFGCVSYCWCQVLDISIIYHLVSLNFSIILSKRQQHLQRTQLELLSSWGLCKFPLS